MTLKEKILKAIENTDDNFLEEEIHDEIVISIDEDGDIIVSGNWK